MKICSSGALSAAGFHGDRRAMPAQNLLFSHCIEPLLLEADPVCPFLPSQAHLARILSEGDDRF